MCEKKDCQQEPMTDYTTYPEGFKALAKDLKMPFEDEAVREKMLTVLMKLLINN